MPRGKIDPDFTLEVYEADKAYYGTTILADNHNPDKPRIIEVNMLGEIIWEYLVPENLRQYTNPGFDVEPLASGNILFVLPRNGVYEIDRSGKVVWSFLDGKVSHDADRLTNGNTLVVWGGGDTTNDAQVREITPDGKTVWAWYAKDYFNVSPYKEISEEGWTHTNAAVRLQNSNTLISLRNFNFVVEVDPKGAIVRTIGKGVVKYQHDPEVLPNGNILLVDHNEPQRAIEIDGNGIIAWEFIVPRQLVRDANRLPNGNTLITGSMKIIEVTPQGKVVWQFGLKMTLGKDDGAARGFYKAERLIPSK
jgi:hypothetical protein